MSGSGGVTVAEVHRMLMQSISWSADELLLYQRSQLSQLLVHARNNVPFYRKRLDCMFRRDGSIDWSRWEDIPLLTRSDLRDHGRQLLARRLPPGHGRRSSYYSSGSSGIPIKVTTTTLAGVVRRALWLRVYALNGVQPSGAEIKFWFTRPGNKPFTSRSIVAPDGTIYGNRNLPHEQQLDVIAETGATTLSEFATTMVLMAKLNLRRRRPVKLDLVLPYGMALSEEEQGLIARSFGATVLLPYSSKEGGLMGFQVLPERTHVFCAEAIFPEFLPLQGTTGASRMVITPLFNAAQPLIRYDQGDLVQFGREGFRGGALPVLSRIIGRVDDYFLLKGRQVPVVGLQEDVLMKHMRARAFQIAQTGDNAIEVRYVATRAMTAARKAALTRHMRLKLQQDFAVTYSRRATIPANAGGKQQRFRREWAP
jgi:phenylacetate-CoA ligase